MEIFITPRTIQHGRFTDFDVSEIEHEMYIAYIIYKASHHNDLRIDADSYNRFFFREEAGFEKLKHWLDNNKDIVNELNKKYKEEAKTYEKLYNVYSSKDFWVKANYRLLKTDIPKIDAFIAKETLMQVIYVTSIYGNCREDCYFWNLSDSTKKETEQKLNEKLKMYNQLEDFTKKVLE
jgi:molybdopterin converting factor small subunit